LRTLFITFLWKFCAWHRYRFRSFTWENLNLCEGVSRSGYNLIGCYLIFFVFWEHFSHVTPTVFSDYIYRVWIYFKSVYYFRYNIIQGYISQYVQLFLLQFSFHYMNKTFNRTSSTRCHTIINNMNAATMIREYIDSMPFNINVKLEMHRIILNIENTHTDIITGIGSLKNWLTLASPYTGTPMIL
jgi:hypothetical protein